jgi:hypothetical protein
MPALRVAKPKERPGEIIIDPLASIAGGIVAAFARIKMLRVQQTEAVTEGANPDRPATGLQPSAII